MNGLEAGRRQDLYCRVAGNVVRSRALRQRNFSVSSHHVLAERRVLRFLCPHAGRTWATSSKNDNQY